MCINLRITGGLHCCGLNLSTELVCLISLKLFLIFKKRTWKHMFFSFFLALTFWEKTDFSLLNFVSPGVQASSESRWSWETLKEATGQRGNKPFRLSSQGWVFLPTCVSQTLSVAYSFFSIKMVLYPKKEGLKEGQEKVSFFLLSLRP